MIPVNTPGIRMDEIIPKMDLLLSRIAQVALKRIRDPKEISKIKASIDGLEKKKWRLRAAVQRIWKGERDIKALTAGLDENSARLVQHIVKIIYLLSQRPTVKKAAAKKPAAKKPTQGPTAKKAAAKKPAAKKPTQEPTAKKPAKGKVAPKPAAGRLDLVRPRRREEPEEGWTRAKPPSPTHAGEKATPEEDESKKHHLVYVWYGTDRRPKDPANESKGYGPDADGAVHYGRCEVAVPKKRTVGSLGSSWLDRLLKWNDDRLKISKRTPMGADALWADMGEALRQLKATERMALVFIHGFNVEFDEAALRAAQLGFDLQVPVTAFYSWPSRGNLKDYGADAESIQGSEPHIANFLMQVSQLDDVERVHVIAHSMGNRGLLRAMQSIVNQAAAMSRKPFGQLILAAPDVSQRVFVYLAKAHAQLADGATLYVSREDKALAASEIVHGGYPRAGFTPPVTIVDGINTIDMTDVDMSFLCHSTYGDARGVLEDIFYLIRGKSNPDDRFGPKGNRVLDSQGRPYWIIKK